MIWQKYQKRKWRSLNKWQIIIAKLGEMANIIRFILTKGKFYLPKNGKFYSPKIGKFYTLNQEKQQTIFARLDRKGKYYLPKL